MAIQKDETLTVTHSRTHNMWAGILENRKLKLFNLLQPSIRKTIDYTGTQLTSTHDRLAVCVFHCSNPNRLYGYDFSHRLNRSRDAADSALLKESKMRRLLEAISEIDSDLSGLTAARLRDIRAGADFIGRNIQTAAAATFDPQFTGGIFVASYDLDEIFQDNRRTAG